MSQAPSHFPTSRRIAVCTSGLAGLLGALSLLGWALGDERLKGLGNEVTMKANTALGLCLLSGSTLALLLAPTSRTLRRVCSAVAVVLGAVTLSQHALDWNAGIDELLFSEPLGAFATASPGRMGPPACVAFIFLGLAVWLIDRPTQRQTSPAQWFALAALPLPSLALVGYATGVKQFYGMARFTGIAPHTAVAVVGLSFALLLARPELPPAALLVANDPGGRVARTMLPLVIVLPPLLTRLRLAVEERGLVHSSFGRAVTLLILIVTFTIIIWRTAQHLSAEAGERQRLEDQRSALLESERAARQDAELATKLRDDFLATLSHELRTPLNAVLGWTAILRRMPSKPAELERPLEVIERSARTQAQLIGDLLDISSIVSGKLTLHRELVGLDSVLQTALSSIEPIATAKGVSVEVESPMSSLELYGDPTRLQQVLWNLLANAVKFTPEHGKVRVSARREQDRVELQVRDDGAGIAPEFLPNVFERFSQAESGSKRAHGGLGLGLSIVRQLVELHGGTVSVSSDGLNRGSAFTISLPVATDAERATSAGGGRTVEPTLTGLKVLVVDDQLDNRELMGRALTDRGASVRLASSADEALAELERAPADVLVSDIGMPGKDGYDLIRAVRARSSGDALPAIAVTAFSRAEDREKALAAGFQLHVSKPINASELLVGLASLTARARAPSVSTVPGAVAQEREAAGPDSAPGLPRFDG